MSSGRIIPGIRLDYVGLPVPPVFGRVWESVDFDSNAMRIYT